MSLTHNGHSQFGDSNTGERDDVWLYGGTREDIIHGLVNGRAGAMPAFGEQLSEERRKLLAAYVLGLDYAAGLQEGRE